MRDQMRIMIKQKKFTQQNDNKIMVKHVRFRNIWTNNGRSVLPAADRVKRREKITYKHTIGTQIV